MGSEQSTHQTQGPASRERSAAQLRRGKSIPEREVFDDANRPGSISPGPSICSDSDLPYISYTVNRPIGDSPKLQQKHGSSNLKRGKSLGNPVTRKPFVPKRQLSTINKTVTNSIVVVKSATNNDSTDKDPDLIRLQMVPMFLPIMRGTLNLPAARDPEVLERLDPSGPLALCQRYQHHLTLCSELVSSEQAAINLRMREIDAEVTRLLTLMTERQKRCAKYAEKLSKVHELSHQLNRCHTLLNQTLESMETLNNWLPVEDRLEPFVWTTG
ncbi:BLOC-1-related complex subunit 5 [Schistocerca gregaria]|uniref:BLOC-1-related complex subunit 5 n=1 Tax=Schistocerca gregaria TaxID=7010 RepID=UPI00211E70D4|nr:BLOC-1-related complex subunit 5 [Schistocerca gregaria]XP_049860936.1 BLOC-1-related complex subunit 5 [Schistocerca gregaria]